MICLICREAELVRSNTFVNLERGEFRLKVEYVPAWVCPSCHEAHFEEDVTLRLLAAAREMSDAGMLEGVRKF
jgi:YgiT-type zinc finger domain-containing protein